MAGYTDCGYRRWDGEKRKIELSRSVIFDESSLDKIKKKEVGIYIDGKNVTNNDKTKDQESSENERSDD